MHVNILVNVDPTMDYTIIFVKVLDQHAAAGGGVGFTNAFTPRKDNGVAINACFIQDSAATGMNLAHELGHYLLTPTPSFFRRDGHSSEREPYVRNKWSRRH